MEVRALVGFFGLVSMRKNEIKDIRDKKIVTDLIRAGYVEPIEKQNAEPNAEQKEEQNAEPNAEQKEEKSS
jgi:hypothetical protein